MIENFGEVVGKILALLDRRNHPKPEKILILRNGVNRYHTQDLQEKEISSLKQALKQEGIEHYAYVVPRKRNNLRLFQRQGKYMNNPEPGYLPFNNFLPSEEFLLQSQKLRYHMAKPSRYKFFLREGGVELNLLADALFKLVYLYWKFKTPDQIPIPLQWAKKAATLVGENQDQFEKVVFWEDLGFL